MASQVTLAYSSFARAVTQAALQARMAAVALPPEVLRALGIRVTSDATVAGAPTTRTVILSFIPSVAAAASVALSNTGNITGITLGVDGLDYVLPPIVTVADATRNNTLDGRPGYKALFRSFLKVADSTQVAGGAGYNPATTTVAFLGGLPPAGKLSAARPGCVRYVHIKDGGLGYPANTIVSFTGGGAARQAQGIVQLSSTGRILGVTITNMGAGYTSLPKVTFSSPSGPPFPAPPKQAVAFPVMAEGTPAVAVANIVLGVINTLTITNPGNGYVEPPAILIQDPTGGANADFTPRMAVGRVDVIAPGSGYTAASVVTFTPAFKAMFPDTSDQRAPFWRLFENQIALGALSPMVSAVPLLA